MQITFKHNCNFAVTNYNLVVKSVTFILSDYDEFTSATLLEQARSWSGRIADPLKIPDSKAIWIEDPDYLISAINIRQIDLNNCEVTFEGSPKINSPFLYASSSSENRADGIKNFTLEYRLNPDNSTLTLPAVGDEIIIENKSCICSKIDTKYQNNRLQSFTLTAIENKLFVSSAPSYSCNSIYEQRKTITYQMPQTDAETFIQNHPVGSDASTWAGENFVICNLTSVSPGPLVSQITLEARYINIRMLQLSSTQVNQGFNADGSNHIARSCTARWLVTETELENFQNMLGQSAANWADENMTIDNVDIIRQSEFEYEVKLRAVDENYQNDRNFNAWDDRSNLKSRRDLTVRGTVDFFLTPRDCGFTIINNIPTLLASLDNVVWNPLKECPFVLGTKTNLPENYINRTLMCMAVEITEFLPHGPAHNLVQAKNFFSGRRFIDGDFFGTTDGSWRCSNRRIEPLSDNHGRLWSKTIETWLLAPHGFAWNAQYTKWGI